MVNEGYPARSRKPSVFRRLSSHSHRLQFRHAVARELKDPRPRFRIGRPSHCKRGAGIVMISMKPSQRSSEVIVARNVVGRADQGSLMNWRRKSRRDRKSKHRGFRAQYTRARRYHLLSTSPIYKPHVGWYVFGLPVGCALIPDRHLRPSDVDRSTKHHRIAGHRPGG
jgi:hypothetical protein